jgi:YHS domain-containing protein
MAFSKRLLAVPMILTMVAVAALAAPNGGERLKEVNAKYVCFINKTHFNKPQTAVVVDGKKYYGCCEDCTKKLLEDPKSRMDIDPVNGKEVDKAGAVIGIDKAGNVYFFQNADNLRKFRVQAKN